MFFTQTAPRWHTFAEDLIYVVTMNARHHVVRLPTSRCQTPSITLSDSRHHVDSHPASRAFGFLIARQADDQRPSRATSKVCRV